MATPDDLTARLVKRKRKPAKTQDVCYAIINCYLDGKLNGFERSDDINPHLREALQKIAALKLAVRVACHAWNKQIPDDETIDPVLLEQICLRRVCKVSAAAAAPAPASRSRAAC